MAWGGKAWGGYKCRETPALPPRLSSSLLAVQRHEGGGTARPLCRGRGLCPQRSHSLALIPEPFPVLRLGRCGQAARWGAGEVYPVLGRDCGCSSPHSCVGIATERAEEREGRGPWVPAAMGARRHPSELHWGEPADPKGR